MTRGNAALAMLLVFIAVPLLQHAVAQNYVPHATDYFEPEEYTAASPCKKHRPGDPDLTTYDIISSFRFDEFHSRNEGVEQIIGSTGFQTAYHLEEYANMTIASTQAFPKGVPNEFSFECTFRVPQQQPRNEWYLFELTDYRYESQMSVTINPIHNTIDFSLPKYDGTVQTISFEETEIFDRSWHKVMFGITQDAVRLWIDCKPVPDLSGTFRAPLDVRGPIDASEGAFSIARDCRTKSTVPIDVQWMIFSCDAEKPARSNCQDLPLRGTYVTMQEPLRPTPPTRPLPSLPPFQFSTETTRRPLELFFEQTTPEQPWLLSSTPSALVGQESNVCPEQCPRGLPGPPGPPGVPGATGLPGLMGEPGPVGPPGELTNIQESAEYVPPLKGEKGERGQPGQIGPAGPPGPPGPPATQTADNAGVEPSTRDKRPTDTPKSLAGLDEREVRDICMAVVREYITEYTSTLTGPPGSPGLRGPRGHPGAQGIQGEPGVRGATGERGYPGMPGQQGPAGDMGLPGPEGQKGERGEDGIGREGPIGPPGPPGDAGRPGRKGQTGHPGERGEVGAQGIQGIRGPPGPAGVCPDCSAQTAQYMYPLMLAQQQYSNKGPQGYYNNKGPQEYYNNKGPQEYTKG